MTAGDERRPRRGEQADAGHGPDGGAAAGAVVVRDGGVADVARMVALIAGGAVDGPLAPDTDLAPYADAVQAIADAPHSVILVAEVGGRVVGMVQLVAYRHVQHRGGLCAELESMHVEDRERSRGVGGALVEAAIARARDWGCYRIQLTSNAAHTDAHRFYAAHGFAASHLGFKRLLG